MSKQDLVKPNLIALVNQMSRLRKPASGNPNLANEPVISVSIAKLEMHEDKRVPRHYAFNSGEETDTAGGCLGIITSFMSYRHDKPIFYNYGPNIYHGTLDDYSNALKGFSRVRYQLEGMTKLEGFAPNAAISMKRWLKCCNVTEVWSRPETNNFLNDYSVQDWTVDSIDSFIAKIELIVNQID